MTRPGSTHAWRTLRDAIYYRDQGQCQACGNNTHIYRCSTSGCNDCYQLGHLTSVANGGIDHPTNLVALCTRCNNQCGDSDLLEWMERRARMHHPTSYHPT